MELERAKTLIKESYGQYNFEFNTSVKECDIILSKSRQRLDLFGVNEVELLSLILLERNAYAVLQSGIFESNKKRFQKVWEENMDSLLKKIPVCRRKVIYRNDKFCDINDLKRLYKNNQRYLVKHYFTCSKEFLPIGGCKIKFIIHPLRNGTRAHNVHMLYNFGRNKKGGKAEWQIEFERRTDFLIKSINQKGGYYVVHLEEYSKSTHMANI